MKLFVNRPSPYGRKVLLVVHEKGLAARIDVANVDPWKDPHELHAATPIGKVPALVLDDGRVVTESTAICEYLDAATLSPALIGTDRWEVMGRVGLAQGLIDAAFTTVLERRRPTQHQWTAWIERQASAIERTLTTIRAPEAGRFDLGDISLACALGYMDFRLPELAWRQQRSDLAAWLDAAARRPSMEATKP